MEPSLNGKQCYPGQRQTYIFLITKRQDFINCRIKPGNPIYRHLKAKIDRKSIN